MPPSLDRASLFADQDLRGVHLCGAYAQRMDAWLASLFEHAAPEAPGGLALVAVGGYGRAELCPQSDIDVVLVHDGRHDIAAVAEALWYPVWDEGLKLGHAVRTTKEALSLASGDLDTATSLLSARPIAGDAGLAHELRARAHALWQKRAKRWLGELAASVENRHARAGEVAFLLEPDLKVGRGGLRDVHAIRWAEQARTVMLEGDDAALAVAEATLLAARVELHRRTGRPGDRLLLQEQDGVATALGWSDANDLMREVSAAARAVAWRSDEVWDRVRSSLRGPVVGLMHRDKPAGAGVVVREGQVCLLPDADPATDPALVLRVAVASARHEARIERRSLARLAEAHRREFPWDDETRSLFAELLGCGAPAIGVLEALDQLGLVVWLLPEWEAVRFRPQRNAYHTFTVDRHLCVATSIAATLTDHVERPDLLLVGTLLHDLGKGRPGDHTAVGIELVAAIAQRMGYPPDDVEVLADLVRHHLLLADVATRRDLDDDGTIRSVADAVGSERTLRLLGALTEADSRATGPAAWNSWKAGLVRALVERVAHVLAGGAVEEVTATAFPPAELLARMANRRLEIDHEGDTVTVIAPDRPGMLSRVAGTVALDGLAILAADAYSSDDGMAVEVLRVEHPNDDPINWPRIVEHLEAALTGRLAVSARLAERASSYPRRRPAGLAAVPTRVLFDNHTSAHSTVVEVHAPDGIGVLCRITQALAELDLDIRSAKVQTLGHQVVDAFYVVDASGAKVVDPAQQAEIERAVIHAAER